MTGRPKYRVDEQVFIDSGEKIISAFVHYVREENDGFSYDLTSENKAYTRDEKDIYPTKIQAYKSCGYEFIIWTMCPYCEEEVEVYETEDATCPECGACFSVDDSDIEASIEAQEDRL